MQADLQELWADTRAGGMSSRTAIRRKSNRRKVSRRCKLQAGKQL